MSLPSYPKYKHSGVEWLGPVPAEWDVMRLMRAASVNDEVLSESTSPAFEIEYVDIGSVSLDRGIERTEQFVFGDAPSRARRLVRDGDVLVSTVRTYLKAIAPVVNPPGNLVVSTGFAVVRPNSKLDSGYAKYSLQVTGFVDEVISRSTGVSYPAINASDLVRICIPVPPLAVQAAIAAFLDRETAKIDALIAEQEKLIALLAEKRQATISHAVTRGLNPHVPMKASGVAWLGEVPAHWELKALKRAVVLQRGHDLPADSREEGSIPVVSSGGITGYHNIAASGPTIVTGRYGTIGEFLLVETDCWPLNTALYAVETFGNDVRFLWYMLQALSHIFVLNSLKSAVPGVDRNDIHPTTICLPTPSEQRSIAAFLDGELAKLDSLRVESLGAIDLLRERRSALIAAAVTGQIDVRNSVVTALAEEAALAI